MPSKLNQAGYDCVFLDAPHVLPMTSTIVVDGQEVMVENGCRENARAWFLYSSTDPADASLSQSGKPMTYVGLDESLIIIEDELRKSHGDFVVLLGFSQGAVFGHILSRLAKASMPCHQVFATINAVILASGFAAQHVWGGGVSAFASLGKVSNLIPIALPSLHIIGQNDTSVPPEMSKALADVYINCSFLYHEKGHIMPQKSADCLNIIAFLKNTYQAFSGKQCI